MKHKADIGVFGGSGFYSLIDNVEEVFIDTPFGAPSDKLAIGVIGGKRVAFLPRHGKDHSIPPHKINYRANLWAMKELGVKEIIGPCAAGSLIPEFKPGDFVVSDQFINATSGRIDTFFEGPNVNHISAADPYCPKLRKLAYTKGRELGIPIHEKGTIVVINGPRFSTRAESRYFSLIGGQVINMTQYPEGYLAKELGICYVNIALITDYDAGLEGREDIVPVEHQAVLEVFEANIDKLKRLIVKMIESMDDSNADCHVGL
ncbi:MAG: S-methyl-5'-thioadenosine phosphorylase [Firmicutes bacterium]|nr:S-methyl-5'-thioadenosine phosphorylase [Bacillota bacterium]MDD4263792.1 S-methyl-5'-thioadenosine phosphorylase [Bacillota bacterium]MDD4693213.1 S-methyl-5'-thioadenosine phosphorylase [Bacillota bacterium]